MLYTILLIILILILIGGIGPGFGVGRWPVGYGVGYPGMGLLGVILIVLLIWLLINGGRYPW
jgi:hypothetical protein